MAYTRIALCAQAVVIATCALPAEAYRLRATRRNGPAEITMYGTATPVAKGRALTANHVLVDSDTRENVDVCRIEIDAKWHDAKVLARDADLDLALIECEAIPDGYAIDDRPDAKGQALRLVGSKQGKEITVHAATIDRVFYKGSCCTRINVAFDHGDSGAAVLRGDRLVGIAIRSEPGSKDGIDDTHAQYVPAAAIRVFLNEKGPGVSRACTADGGTAGRY